MQAVVAEIVVAEIVVAEIVGQPLESQVVRFRFWQENNYKRWKRGLAVKQIGDEATRFRTV